MKRLFVALFTVMCSLISFAMPFIIAVNTFNICNKLDKLIEINTPDFVNAIPNEMIIEKH